LENLLKFKMEGMTTKTQRKRKGKRKRRKRAKILRRKRRRYCCTTLSTLYTTITISLNKITPPHWITPYKHQSITLDLTQ